MGFSPLQHRQLHISLHCQRALNWILPSLHNSSNLPQQEVKLQRGLLLRLQPPLCQKVSLLDLFLLPPPANSLHTRPIPLLLPIVAPHAHQSGPTPINVLLLRPVKAKALNQGRAKARVPPTLILLVKAKRAKKAKKARRVKRVRTPKATRAKKDRRVNMPGPSWKVARVQPKGTQNDRFSPSFLPLPPVSFFQFLPPLPIRFTASCLFFPSFSCLLIRFLSPTGLSRSFRPTRSLASPPLFATTQSVIPAHSVYCVFSFSLSCLCATWAQSVIPAHSVPCCLRTCFHFSLLCFSTTA